MDKPDPEETPPHDPPWFWGCPSPTTPVRFGSETELERVRLESPGAERKRGRESGSPSPTSRKRRREGSSSRRDGRRSSGIRDKGQDLDGDKDRGADTPPPDKDSDDESVIFLGWGSATPPASPPPAGPPARLPALPPARGGLFLPSESESEADDDEVQIFEVEEVEEEVVPIEVSDDEDSDEFPDVDLPRVSVADGLLALARSSREARSLPTRRSHPSRRRTRPRSKNSGTDRPKRERKPRRRKLLEDPLADIALDEPERFYTQSRLRPRQPSSSDQEWQDSLQRYKNLRDGIGILDPEKLAAEEGDDARASGDDPPGSLSQQMRDDIADFFVDGDDGDDDPLVVEARQGLSSHSQDPEYHFKVVFQYMVSLAMRGTDFLPELQHEEEKSPYFYPALRFLRLHMGGLQNAIGGSIWQPRSRQKLETYPVWEQALLDDDKKCAACGQSSLYEAWLLGRPYDRTTYEDVDDWSDSEDDEGEVENDGLGNKRHKLGPLGRFCKDRAKRFHRLSHWEYNLFRFVDFSYGELSNVVGASVQDGRRRKRDPRVGATGYGKRLSLAHLCKKRGHRIARLAKAGKVPSAKDLGDISRVVMWLDKHGFTKMMMDWLGVLEDSARKFEGEDHH